MNTRILKGIAVALISVATIGGFSIANSDTEKPKPEPDKAAIVAEEVQQEQADEKVIAEKPEKEAVKSAPSEKAEQKTDNAKPKSTTTSSKPKAKSVAPKQTSEPKKETSNKPKAETKPEKKQEHVHNWEPVYSYKTVEDVGSKVIEICKGCGADITSWSNEKWNAHSDAHLDRGENSGFYEKEVKVVTGTHEIKTLTGYKCSCGATKSK